jgi:hypothetical protein
MGRHSNSAGWGYAVIGLFLVIGLVAGQFIPSHHVPFTPEYKAKRAYLELSEEFEAGTGFEIVKVYYEPALGVIQVARIVEGVHACQAMVISWSNEGGLGVMPVSEPFPCDPP